MKCYKELACIKIDNQIKVIHTIDGHFCILKDVDGHIIYELNPFRKIKCLAQYTNWFVVDHELVCCFGASSHVSRKAHDLLCDADLKLDTLFCNNVSTCKCDAFNALSPGGFEWHYRRVTFKLIYWLMADLFLLHPRIMLIQIYVTICVTRQQLVTDVKGSVFCGSHVDSDKNLEIMLSVD